MTPREQADPIERVWAIIYKKRFAGGSDLDVHRLRVSTVERGHSSVGPP